MNAYFGAFVYSPMFHLGLPMRGPLIVIPSAVEESAVYFPPKADFQILYFKLEILIPRLWQLIPVVTSPPLSIESKPNLYGCRKGICDVMRANIC